MPVDTSDQSRTTLAERRFADYEAYERFEQDRILTDELTEFSERLNAAMLNSFEYSYGGDGELYYAGESLEPIMRRGIQKAELVARDHPQFAVEVVRRKIEYNQYILQREIGRQPDDDPLVLVHISPMPDIVLSGADLGAYDTERQKVMVRVTEKFGDGVRVSSMSLDGGNRLAIQAIGDMCDVDIPDDATSEEILATNFFMKSSKLQGRNPVNMVRQRYDESMRLQFGGEWYAGRRDGQGGVHTLQFIESQKEQTDEYMRQVYALRERHGADFRRTKEYQKINYDFMSFLEARRQNPSYSGSVEHAGQIDRQKGVEHAKSDCPTGDNLSTESVDEMLSKLGLGEKRMMACPFCGAGVYGDPCSPNQFCPECTAQVVDGKVVSKGRGRRKPSQGKIVNSPDRSAGSNEQYLQKVYSKSQEVRRAYGAHAVSQTVANIGGAKQQIINRYTKEIIKS